MQGEIPLSVFFIKVMVKRLLLLLALFASVLAEAGGFVGVDGTRLVLDGKPYRFIGTNFWYGPILGSVGEGGNRERLGRELDSLKSMGVCNLRVLVGSDGSRGEKTKASPTLQIAPGVYNDTILDGLDYFMTELQQRGMHAVLYLNNSWEWSGGYGYYLEEAQKVSGVSPANVVKSPLSNEVSWQDYCDYYSRFSTDPKAQKLFLDYVRFIVGRTNRYTHKKYSDDPSIFSWQIGNEPRAFSKAAKEGFECWIKEAASLIRSLDKNHLISIGTEGIVGCEGDVALYERLSACSDIDVLNLHLWPSNWGWSSKEVVEGDLEKGIVKSLEYINRHVAVAERLGKPLVLEEFGFPRDRGSKSPGSSVVARDKFYKFVFEEFLKGVKENSPLVGVNFWGWAGCAIPRHDSWQPGDDYTSDPAHEPQGLYSVFSADTTTVRLIRQYTAKIATLDDYKVSWRGVMIDVSRHFLPINYLYKEIDALSRFGLNRLHLHLTDAAGWRMEIKSRPRLTEVGAWRTHKTWSEWWQGDRGYSDSSVGFGGYYTQDELRHLVVYAALRGVEIVPEIEFPAHSEEVVAAYPEVGNSKAELDMSNPATYRLMRDILEEVADVFPSRYIHVGGDEAATQHDLQPEGMRRMKQIVDSLGREMIVWDEALTDNPCDSDMVIMVWRDVSTALKAARLGHKVILCPGKYCYLDKAQDAPLTQPRAAGGYLPLDSVYGLPNPLDDTSLGDRLLGVQANVWTEHIDNPNYLEYMLWPRAFAIAELGREGLTQKRDYGAFRRRALKAVDCLHKEFSINAFDLSREIGERKNTVSAVEGETLAETDEKVCVTYNTTPHRAYPGSGDRCLVDGFLGGWNNNDGRWQGFIGRGGMDVTLDLGSRQNIGSISGDFLQSCGPEIFFPYKIQIEVSDNGENFCLLYEKEYKDIYAVEFEDYRQLGWRGEAEARYVRLKALPGARQGWVFCSEIIVTK